MTTLDSVPDTLTLSPEQAGDLSAHTSRIIAATIEECTDPVKRSYLQAHAEELDELLFRERAGRWHYLQANIVDGRHFDAELEAFLAKGVAYGSRAAELKEWHRAQIQEPLSIIAMNGQVSLEEKLQLLHDNPWRRFPASYVVNVADWRGARLLDQRAAEFLDDYENAGGNVVWLGRDDAPKELYFSLPGRYLLPIVRRRTVAYFNIDSPDAPTEAAHEVSFIKRSAFALDWQLAPQQLKDHLVKYEQLSSAMDDSHVMSSSLVESEIGAAALNLRELMHRAVAPEHMHVLQPFLDSLHTFIMEHIERLISDRSPALIPLTTGYTFKKK